MRILVTGSSGQLGSDVIKLLSAEHEVLAPDRELLDLTVFSTIEKVLAREEPALVVHCGAYTKVDLAEEERALCHRINAEATRLIAARASENGIRLIYISTDYVFDGTKPEPYEIDDPTHPINYYGTTKLEGELAVKELMERYQIIRTSWVFGAIGKNFVKTMIKLGGEREVVQVVSDQIGSPTYTVDLARLILDMSRSDRYGTYHATNEGYCSWHQFATEIMSKKRLKASVEPISSEQYPTKARRPKNSRLSKRSLDEGGFMRLPTWQDALERYLQSTEEV
ncbi:MAG: dTDP-4-dehydrorhamnose reductase [Methanomassiliicoccales archaeon]|nr:dTDP-4-dehydrorhamnose reductase [Methanomassiliicoccales archaeon]